MTNTSQNTFTNKALLAAAMGALLVGCSPDAGTADGASSSSAASSRRSTASMSSMSHDMMDHSSMSSVAAGAYKDGTYTADGTYRSPAGAESVSITVTLDDGVITAAEFTGDATNPKSVTMQGNFAAGYETYVVGKSIDDVSLTVVNGSSLTGKGFMDALTKIKAEAKA